jgi:hypothetical protein
LPSERQAMQDAVVMLRSFDLRKLRYPLPGAARAANGADSLPQLERFLRGLENLLRSWSNNLSSRYFSHARTLPVTMGL